LEKINIPPLNTKKKSKCEEFDIMHLIGTIKTKRGDGMYVYLSAKCDGKAISNQFNENLANKKDDESLCSICKDLSGKKEASTRLDSTFLDYIKTTRGNATLYNIFYKALQTREMTLKQAKRAKVRLEALISKLETNELKYCQSKMKELGQDAFEEWKKIYYEERTELTQARGLLKVVDFALLHGVVIEIE